MAIDTFGVGKPDPGHLLQTLPDDVAAGYRVIMVGDSEVDVAAARAAGVPIIACAWGYARMPVADLSADAVARRFDALPNLIERHAAPRASMHQACGSADTEERREGGRR